MRNKRAEVAKTIRDLAAKQNPNKKFDFPPLNFTAESGSGYTDDEDNSDEDSFAPMKRNATLIKVGAGKNSTPTKIPPGMQFSNLIRFQTMFLPFEGFFISILP